LSYYGYGFGWRRLLIFLLVIATIFVFVGGFIDSVNTQAVIYSWHILLHQVLNLTGIAPSFQDE
jgi:hypothetical protein